MTDALLVNSIYPLNYFALPGVSSINYPDNFWWSSKERFAAVDPSNPSNYLSVANGGTLTSEILELDLGRIREVNYINFDVLRAPINIRIEYDAVSTPDREALWLPVTPVPGQPFDAGAGYDQNNRTSWLNTEFNFTDTKENIVHTRYLRITFSRRDEPWPTGNANPFAWPVFVKHMRIGRAVSDLLDTVGPLLTQDTPTDLVPQTLVRDSGAVSREVRQKFVIPNDSVRAGQIPNLLGFGILIDVPEPVEDGAPIAAIEDNVSFGWSVWLNGEMIVNGVEDVAVAVGTTWLDWYLDPKKLIPGYLSSAATPEIYELRVFSKNMTACETVFTHVPNQLSSSQIPGTLDFEHGSSAVDTSVDTTDVVSIGDYIVRTDAPDQMFLVNNVTSSTITINVSYPGATNAEATASVVYPFAAWDGTEYLTDPTQNLVMRVWADIADEGQDVLGNAYRYVVRRQVAEAVADPETAGWMSEPVPSPDGVEALYFDVRGTDEDTGQRTLTVIDALKIAPRTPGVRMNVYYTQQNLQGDKPVVVNDWDYLLWTPVQETYTLRRDEVIDLPQAFRASFVKLEFTGLNPLPYNLPTFPPLPPKIYRRFPTWVEDQFNNALVRNVISNWFLTNANSVQTKVLQAITDPFLEFQYEQQQFLAALALGLINDASTISSGIVDVASKAVIDPITASKIFVSFDNQYQNTLLLSVDQSSLLGSAVVARYDPSVITDPIERAAASVVAGSVPVVSTSNDRVSESYQNIAQIPMRFNQTARHQYTIAQAEFNKKAYFVGIQSVRFLRTNYTVPYDDTLIIDDMYDDFFAVENTFVREDAGGIPDGVFVYVSYSINPKVADERVFLAGTQPVELAVTGGPAQNVVVFSAPDKQGIQYFQDQDYELSYGLDADGQLSNFIQRSTLGARLTVPRQPVIYVDAGTVIGRAVIPSPFGVDSGVVVGRAAVSGEDLGPFTPNYGTGTYGGGTYADLHKDLADSGTETGVGVPSGVELHSNDDAGTSVGVAVVSGDDRGPFRDTGTVIGVKVIPGQEDPSINHLTPDTGTETDPVTIGGFGFTGATSVDFNGTDQPTFTVVSDVSITTTVPAGATTGPIHVVTPLGTATSTDFTVT